MVDHHLKESRDDAYGTYPKIPGRPLAPNVPSSLAELLFVSLS
jgi:hypothetical protein